MVTSVIQKPTTVYKHKETTNQSFIDMHYYLKSKGINNNDFFLCLFDMGLRGVNPRDPNLSPAMKLRVMNECRRNYWYFLREVVRIPDQGGDASSGKRYVLHRGNLAINFLYTLNYNMFVELPRQHGKTTAALCRYLWCYNFGTTNSEIMFIHKDHSGSKKNLGNLKAIRDALPSYLQMSSAITNDGKKLKVPNTIVAIQHPLNHNKITTFPSARTKDSANNLGRGCTMPLQYYDEFAWMPYNKLVYLAAVPAFSTASKNAKMNGAPYGIMLTTTPGDLLTDSGQYAFEIRNNATPWVEEYYDKTWAELEGIRMSNTYSSFFLIRYSYQQLGSGQEYFKQMVIEMNRQWPEIRREVMLEWSATAENCPFSKDDLDRIKTFLKEPIRTVMFGRYGQYQFNIYENIDMRYPPIIGVDVAGAMYQDSSAITVIDSLTTKVCATLNCNFIPADDLADVIYQLVTKYMRHAVVNCERNGDVGTKRIKNNYYHHTSSNKIKRRVTTMMVPLKGYEDKYMINESGIVTTKRTGHVIRHAKSRNGYLRVALEDDNHVRTNYSIHRLVAKQFLDNPDNLPVVMHKDNDTLNNHVSNLKWGTQSENVQQAFDEGRKISPSKMAKTQFIYHIYNEDTKEEVVCRSRAHLAETIQYEEISLKNMIGNGRSIALGPYEGWKIRKGERLRIKTPIIFNNPNSEE